MKVIVLFVLLVLVQDITGFIPRILRPQYYSVRKSTDFANAYHASLYYDDSMQLDTILEPQNDAARALPPGILDHGLLSQEEEVKLVRQYKLSKSITAQREVMAKDFGREVTPGEVAGALGLEVEEMEYLVGVGRAARELMISCNMKFVATIAKPYLRFGMSYSDLVFKGVEGLCTAVDKFDPDRGFRFATHAGWWIRQRLTRAVANLSRLVRLPVYLHDLLNKVKKAQRLFEETHQRAPSEMELVTITSLPVDDIRRVLAMDLAEVSADEVLFGGGSEAGDTPTRLVDDMQSDSELPVEWTEMKGDLDRFYANLDKLSEREAYVHSLRSGLASERKTLDEIGAVLGVTRERVRIINNNAIRKLKTIDATRWRALEAARGSSEIGVLTALEVRKAALATVTDASGAIRPPVPRRGRKPSKLKCAVDAPTKAVKSLTTPPAVMAPAAEESELVAEEVRFGPRDRVQFIFT